jgi:predicted NBD/HSP70 family sugar kinase
MTAAGRRCEEHGSVLGIRHLPVLDRDFVPAIAWFSAYKAATEADPRSAPIAIAVERPDGGTSSWEGMILPHEGSLVERNVKHVERIVKLLLWSRGGSRVLIAGPPALVREIASVYGPRGRRAFDHGMFGRIYLESLTVTAREPHEMPVTATSGIALGRHLEGCRVGFDLGGSDRKSAAVIDGQVVHSEEVEWSPYFASDPQYHFDGVMDSIRRAAAHLPRVDAIGGSAAGVYVDNEPRVASLFRGVSDADFASEIRPIFHRLRAAWGDVPFEVANDGEVTALAASMSSGDGSVLGIAMGTSQAAGYCDASGRITGWLDELAFVPVDYRDGAPIDEWSGDRGCGVQYFSQQAVARLVPSAGIELAADMPQAEQLASVQRLIERGDPRSRKIFETIGVYLGYSIAWYAEWYEIRNLLLLGRVTSGVAGSVMIAKAEEVLRDEFPALAERIRITTPNEHLRRHGQAIAAASLAVIESQGGTR